MLLLNHQRECYLTKAKRLFAGVALFLFFPVFGTVNAQYTYEPENFYGAVTQPTGETCEACVGELFLEMSSPALVDVDGVQNMSVDFIATAQFSSAFQGRLDSESLTSYLGNITFQVSVGGPGINLDANECTVVQGNRPAYSLSAGEGELTPPSLELAALRPGAIAGADPSDASHYILSDTVPVTIGTLRCPFDSDPGMAGINAYVLNPSLLDGNEVQLSAADALPLILRAVNSFEYYPLDGTAPFVPESDARSNAENMATIGITNTFAGAPMGSSLSFSFDDGCPGRVAEPAPRLLVAGLNSETITFSAALDSDCVVTHTITFPGGVQQTYMQTITPAGTPAELLAMAKMAFINDSLEAYDMYLNETISRSDGGNVVRGDSVDAAVRAIVVDLKVGDEFPITLDYSGVQELVNDAVSAANVQLPATARAMNAYNFAGNVTDAGVPGSTISFVIDLARDDVGEENRVSTLRLIKLIGGELMSVSDGDGNSVRYSRMLQGAPAGCPTEPNLWMSTTTRDNVAVIPMHQAPINCIMITIVDDGVYDESTDMGRISDPLSAALAADVAEANIPDAIGGGGGGGGGGNGFLGIGSAGAWTIMALLTVLGFSMLRRRRVTVRSEL